MEQQKRIHFSNSELSAVEKGYHYWRWYKDNKNKPKKPYLIFGSAFDCYITQHDLFADRFVVIKDKPSEFQCAFIDHLVTNPNGTADKEILLEEARIFAGYSWEIKQVLTEFNKPKNQEYYLAKMEMVGTNKEFISAQDYEKIRNMTQSLFSHTLAKNLLENKQNTFQHEICEIIPSLSEEYECKVILDVSNPNFLIDIKTTAGDITSFTESISKYNYMRQLRLYEIMLSEGSLQYDIKDKYIIAISKEEPYTTGVFRKAGFDYDLSEYAVTDEDKNKIKDLIAKFDRLIKGNEDDYIIEL